MRKHLPIFKNFPHMIYGGDYNPDQWLEYRGVLKEDVRLMKLAGMNNVSLGIFAWAVLEPEEGVYHFEWLDHVIDTLYDHGITTTLATPTGARPAWIDAKYPQVMRVSSKRVRNLHGHRHNHCFTSPVYREKATQINAMLAKRYKNHPAIMMWHISNEYGGECHCDLCQKAFRDYLKDRYDNNIETLNRAWWTSFWAHKYNCFDQVESPAPHGENQLHGLTLDWKRFVTYQTAQFIECEAKPLKQITPHIPVTTNFMGTYEGLDYWKLKDNIDTISWDSYPMWHGKNDVELASDVAFVHDIHRSLKGGKPFMLMESTPSLTNWQSVCKLKKPGMNILSSIHAIAHGSDTVQYFQIRKSRGSSEKFHGALIDHEGSENTRVFKEAKQLGELLKKLDDVVGTFIKSEVAVIFDWENMWAIGDMQGLNDRKNYEETCKSHYKYFNDNGIAVDVISSEQDYTKYRLVIAPMLYMLKPSVADRLKQFVSNGGTLVTTYLTGYVNETDLCFLGGFPGAGLREVIGIWAEEIDALYVEEQNSTIYKGKEYIIKDICELIHAQTAKVLCEYKSDFYAGRPVLTKNSFGKGKAYHIAARTNKDMLFAVYSEIVDELSLEKAADWKIPSGIHVTVRYGKNKKYIFVMNFNANITVIDLKNMGYYDLVSEQSIHGKIELKPYDIAVMRCDACGECAKRDAK